MCGIIAIAGTTPALPVLAQGLHLLAYRGYDSAGVALEHQGRLHVEKDKGRIADLAPAWLARGLEGCTGIGHTRWATHGPPSKPNAHPHLDARGEVAVVHNGILENDLALREELEAQGVRFASETDTEVVAHLFARAFRGDPVAAAREVLARCKGHFALAILHARLPGTVIGVRRGSPLLVGLGVGEVLLASDTKALAGRADRVLDLGEDEVALATAGGVRIVDAAGQEVRRAPRALGEREQDTGKGGFPHFMLKEIHEQPDRLYELLAGRVEASRGRVRLPEVALDDAAWRATSRIDLVASGTAHYASLYGAYALESLAGIPSRALVAAEYEARGPVLDPSVLVVAVSQSGETADTKAAVEVARARGARTLGVLNVRDSVIGRMVGGLVDIHAGPETSVASTKVYTGMLGALLLLALRAAQARGRGEEALRTLGPALPSVPGLVRRALGTWEQVRAVARHLDGVRDMLYLGRGPDAATAFEGALKMKELSYVHAEGYPAGEMKHGPIALVSRELVTVAIATPGPWRERMLANVREVSAREGPVVVVAAEGDREAARVATHVVEVPATDPWLAPLVNVVPLQLLAYEVAKRRGCDVDQPRNLAKTVTVQ
ncbi:MAG: glutamine--fructose-6-phosphate transaminase (isomerizing) [Planctomycetia bacterium]